MRKRSDSSFVGTCEKMLKNKCAYFIHNVYFFNTLEGFVCVQGGAGLIMTAAATSLFVCFFIFFYFQFLFFFIFLSRSGYAELCRYIVGLGMGVLGWYF